MTAQIDPQSVLDLWRDDPYMTDFKKIIEIWANDPDITCEPLKCGQCLREQIKSEVSKTHLQSGKPTDEDMMRNILKETKEKWQETPLYIQVRDLLSQGKSLEEIETELKKEGIEI